jgi:hypothetical protein
MSESYQNATMKLKIIFTLSLLFIISCKPIDKNDSESRNPAPTSFLSYNEAFHKALIITSLDQRLEIGTITPTGSMLPVLDSSSIIITERVNTNTILNKNDLVVFDRGDIPRVLHRIVDMKNNHYYISGDNNSGPDGWFPKSSIKSRVVMIIFSSEREPNRRD